MKTSILLLAAAAALPLAACNGDTNGGGNAADSQPVTPVKPPANGDWSTVVTQTTAGGFLMGNPEASVKLVEYGSMTCPHCAEFDEKGVQPLVDNYVKSGKVAFEFRNFIRDPYDMAAALVARCNGAQSFFPLTKALYADQKNWIAKLQGVPPQQLEALQNMAPNQQTVEMAKMAGFQQFAAMRGVPEAKTNACLGNQEEVTRLVQMTSDATTQYPNFQGTPTFTLNGKLLENSATWPLLEPKIKEALGS